jgi:hypothetical protein
MRRIAALILLPIALFATRGLLAGVVRSGPQAGDMMPGPFHPLHLTGPQAGQRGCLYCKYGPRPVAAVFAREITPTVTRLLAALDGVTEARKDARLASFAVFLGEPGKLADPIKKLAAERGIHHCVLTVDEAPPRSYAIAEDAAVTVLLYNHLTVKANHAFRAGALDSKAIEAILADLNRMLPAQ